MNSIYKLSKSLLLILNASQKCVRKSKLNKLIKKSCAFVSVCSLISWYLFLKWWNKMNTPLSQKRKISLNIVTLEHCHSAWMSRTCYYIPMLCFVPCLPHPTISLPVLETSAMLIVLWRFGSQITEFSPHDQNPLPPHFICSFYLYICMQTFQEAIEWATLSFNRLPSVRVTCNPP